MLSNFSFWASSNWSILGNLFLLIVLVRILMDAWSSPIFLSYFCLTLSSLLTNSCLVTSLSFSTAWMVFLKIATSLRDFSYFSRSSFPHSSLFLTSCLRLLITDSRFIIFCFRVSESSGLGKSWNYVLTFGKTHLVQCVVLYSHFLTSDRSPGLEWI